MTACAFCGQPAEWSYLVSSFEVPAPFIGGPIEVDPAQPACDDCHSLIETDSRSALAAILARNQSRPPGTDRRTWRRLRSHREQWCREVVRLFCEHRVGDPTPLTLRSVS